MYYPSSKVHYLKPHTPGVSLPTSTLCTKCCYHVNMELTNLYTSIFKFHLQVDKFTITAVDLGELKEVKVIKSVSKLPWKLSKITVRKGEFGPTEEIFKCDS